MRAAIGTALAASLIAATAAAAPAVESRYSSLGRANCTEAENGGEDEDWILYRCGGEAGIPVWVVYTDSVRMQVAFGPKDFAGYTPFSSDRDDAWKVEWRGTGKGAAISPYAAILRMRSPGGGPGSTLAVYRVWGDKPSCLIGQAADNAAARRIADDAASMTACPA